MPPQERTAHLADGRTLHFPANTPDEVIESTIARVVRGTAEEGAFAADPMPRFEAPETASAALWRGTKQALRSVLPTAGMVGGGLLGAPSGPVGAVAVAGLGFACGEQATRILESVINGLTGTPEPPQPGLLGQMMRSGQDVLIGAAGEATAGAALAVPGAARALLGISRATPEDLLVREAAKRQGISLTAGAASGSAAVARIESVPGQFPVGRSAAEPTMEQTRRTAWRATENLMDSLGSTTSLETAGRAVQRDVAGVVRARDQGPTAVLDAFIARLGPQGPTGRLGLGESVGEGLRVSAKAVRQTADDAYAAARGLAPDDAAVPASTLNRLALRIQTTERQLQGLARPSVTKPADAARKMTTETVRPSDLPNDALTDLLGSGRVDMADVHTPIPVQSLPAAFIEQYGLSTVKSLPLDLAIDLQQRLRALARQVTSDDYTKRQLRDLAEAMTSDIETYGRSQGGNLGAALQRASTFYRDEVAKFFAPKKPLRKLMDAEPGAIAERLLTTKSPDLLKAALEHLPPRQHMEVRRAFMERVREKALDARTSQVSPEKLDRVLDTIGAENLGIVLGPRARELTALRGVLNARAPMHRALDDVVSGDAERVILTLTKGRVKSMDDLGAVWGSISARTQSEVRRAMFSDVLGQAVDTKTGVPSLERFLTAKNNVSPAVWDMIFTRNQASALSDLQLVAQRINAFQRAAANPSQTGMTLLGTSQITGAGLLGLSTTLGKEDRQSFTMKLAGLFTPYMIGKGVFSKAGQRMLTSPDLTGRTGPGLADVILRGMGAAGVQMGRREETANR